MQQKPNTENSKKGRGEEDCNLQELKSAGERDDNRKNGSKHPWDDVIKKKH